MLDLIAGLFSIFSDSTHKIEPLKTTDWSPWLDISWVQSLSAPSPDPTAQLAVQQHLETLGSQGLSSSGQSVWMQTGNQVLADHQGSIALPAASLTKVATTFAALTTWGPKHQFETVFSTTAPVQAGVVQGDLVVEGNGDPFFVWEEAIAVGNALNQAGIRKVTGNLIITGNFAMNFDTNPLSSANALKQALDSNTWSGEVETQYQSLPNGTKRPQVLIQGDIQLGGNVQTAMPVIRHKSMFLVDLVKAMNVYSNNFMAQMLADSMGGAAAVSQKVIELTKLPPEEIQLSNGSGLGTENRMSGRAVTAILIATQRYLQAQQMTIGDVYPIIGQDGGTLKGRQTPPGTVVKTGTLDEVSALAGVMPTRDRGLVWFSIINLGAGEISNFHAKQDLLLNQVHQAWGDASLPTIEPTAHTRNGLNRLGAALRNQLVSQQ